eukprot:3634722-Rhodomonas_salina.1
MAVATHSTCEGTHREGCISFQKPSCWWCEAHTTWPGKPNAKTHFRGIKSIASVVSRTIWGGLTSIETYGVPGFSVTTMGGGAGLPPPPPPAGALGEGADLPGREGSWEKGHASPFLHDPLPARTAVRVPRQDGDKTIKRNISGVVGCSDDDSGHSRKKTQAVLGFSAMVKLPSSLSQHTVFRFSFRSAGTIDLDSKQL